MPNYEDPAYWDRLIDERGNIREENLEDLDREALIERIRELSEIIEELPGKIRAFPVSQKVSGHFAQVWLGTGLSIAAEIAEQEGTRV